MTALRLASSEEVTASTQPPAGTLRRWPSNTGHLLVATVNWAAFSTPARLAQEVAIMARSPALNALRASSVEMWMASLSLTIS